MRHRLLPAIVLTAAGLLAASCVLALPASAEEEAICSPVPAVARDRAYGPARLQRLDVYPAAADSCGTTPVVVWVHGGGWRTGDKSRLAAKRAWAQANGWTLVSVNYRLSDPDVPPARRIRYPAHNRDVGRALGWVHDHIARFGGDPDRIAVLGHSAGAQIVSSIGVDERYLRRAVEESVCGVVSIDTEGYDVAAQIRGGGRTARLYRNAFGNRPAVWGDASPITHVDGDDLPHLVVRRGLLERQRKQVRFAQALRTAGVPTTVVATPGYSHGDVNRLLGDPSDTLLTPGVEDFLDDCFSA